MPVRWAVGCLLVAGAMAWAAPASAAPAGSTLLASRPDGFGPVPPTLDADSDDPLALSNDGRYALFLSQADGFDTGTNSFADNLFVRDRVTGTTTLVNRSDGPGGAGGNASVVGADIAVGDVAGTPHVYVAFSTSATNLVDHATGTTIGDPGIQVWLRDVTSGETTLISRGDSATGPVADSSSTDPAIAVASDGPVVVFRSNATNLLGAPVASLGVYLRRVGVNDTSLVSCKNKNCGGSPAVAAGSAPDVAVLPAASGSALCPSPAHGECTLVAFQTADQTLSTGDPNIDQIVLATTEPGKATEFLMVSQPDQSIALGANARATSPRFTGDGRAIGFLSAAFNLTLEALTPGVQTQVYLRIPGGAVSSNNRTFLLSKGAVNAPSDARVYDFALGGTAAQPVATFVTDATNLGAPAGRHAYVRDRAAGTTTVLDRLPGPAGALSAGFVSSTGTAVSGDASTALFLARATDFGDGDDGEFGRVRARRLTSPAQEVELVSRPSGRAPFPSLTGAAFDAVVSEGGRYVAFTSTSRSLPATSPGHSQVHLRDMALGTTTLVSRADGPAGAPAESAQLGSISDDGRRVAFIARGLPGAPPDTTEAFVRDLDAQTTTLVSRANGPEGAAAPTGGVAPQITGDGRKVVFVSGSVLDPSATPVVHVYQRDLIANTTSVVDRDSAGKVPAETGSDAVVDRDGSHVAWVSKAAIAGAPADGRFHVFTRDLATGRTTLASRADGPDGAPAAGDSRTPAINADGSVVAFESVAQNLGETFVNSLVFVREVGPGHTELVSRGNGPAGVLPGFAIQPRLDAAGNRVAFVAADNLDATITPDPPFERRVFLRDRTTGVTTMVSRADGPAGAPSDGRALDPDISPDGNCVSFLSTSTNLGDGFASGDVSAAHLRVLRGACAVAPPPAANLPPGAARPKPPVLSRLRLSASRLRTTGRGRGITIRFDLDRAATVNLAFERLVGGRRQRKRCSAKARRGKRCTIVRRAGTLTVTGKAGPNAVAFKGTIAGRRLPSGRYRLRATPAGGTARSVQLTATRR